MTIGASAEPLAHRLAVAVRATGVVGRDYRLAEQVLLEEFEAFLLNGVGVGTRKRPSAAQWKALVARCATRIRKERVKT